MEDFKDKIDKIRNKEDFINLLQILLENLKNHPEEWRNKKLSDYLSAIISWTEDMDGYYLNSNLEIPENVNWGVFANILIAAKMYE